MKQIIITLATIAFFSCSKKDQISTDQVITYRLNCPSCLVYVEDNVWNSSNEHERSKSQYFNVYGDWEYSFVNNGLDSVTAKIYVSVLGARQRIRFEISESLHGRKVRFDDYLGFDAFKDTEYEKSFTLKLN